MNKPFKPQFSIALALATMTLVAVLLAESLNGGWRSASQVLTVALIELSACAACIAILTHNIPSALSRAQDRNCRRVDGSWSRRRQKIEDASLGELRRELGKAFLLVALVTNALLGLLHFEVIPVPLALQAVSSFSISEENWKTNLRDDEAQFDRWLGPSLKEEARFRKRMLWYGWPVLLAVAIGWCLAVCVYVTHAYSDALKRLNSSIQFRSQQYRLSDLHASVGHDDFAKAKVGRRSESPIKTL